MSYDVVRRFPNSGGVISEIGYVFKLASSSDHLLAAAEDLSLRLIDLNTFQMVRQVVPSHDRTITDIQNVPDSVTGCASGSVYISSSVDGLVKIWDMRRDDPCVISIRLSVNNLDAPVFAAAVSAAGTCAGSCGNEISLFDFGVWKQRFKYTEVHMDNVSCLYWLDDGKYLVSGGDDGLVNVLDVSDLVNEDDGQCPKITFNTEDAVRSVYSSGGGMSVFSTTETCTVWDIFSGAKIATNSVRLDPILASGNATFDSTLDPTFGYYVGQHDNNILAGNSLGKLVTVDAVTGVTTGVFAPTGHAGVVRSAVFTKDRKIITAGEDGYINEWAPTGNFGESPIRVSNKPKLATTTTRPY